MRTIVQLIFIGALLVLAYAIATADGPLVVTTDNPQPAPQVIVIPAPVDAQEAAPTAVPVIYPIIIPNPPNPDPAAFITPEPAAAAPVEAALPQEAVFTLTTGEWVNDANAQFLTDCAYQIAKGLAHDPACPQNSAALLGVGR